MSEINANIVISPIDLGVTVNTNQLTFTPDAVSLNIYAGGVGTSNSLTANIANVHIYGGTNGYVLQTDGTGNLTWTAQTGNGGGNGTPGGSNTQVQYNDSGSFGGNVGFTFNEITGFLNVPGNVTAPYFVGNATFATFAAEATTVTASSQPNITSVGSLVSLTVLGNSNTGNIYTSGSSGNISGANVITANSFVGNLTGVATNATNATNATVAGTVYTNAQPNITSVGTLTGLTSNGVVNFSNTSNVSLGAVGNVKITGGTANYVLKTDGSGNLSWVAQSGGGNASSIDNGNSNVNIATSAGNITMAVNGTAIVTVSNANVTSRQFISNVANGTAPFVVTSTTLVANLRVQSANTANTVTGANITTDYVSIGSNALANTALYSIAIGANAFAGAYRAVSIGYESGTNVANTYDVISIGWKAGNGIQSNSIGIGQSAGTNANANSISIGFQSGFSMGTNSISIGTLTGKAAQSLGLTIPNSILIGAKAGNSNVHANVTILNATGGDFPSTQADSLFVKPIRDVTGNVSFTKTLMYNPTTGEIGYI